MLYVAEVLEIVMDLVVVLVVDFFPHGARPNKGSGD